MPELCTGDELAGSSRILSWSFCPGARAGKDLAYRLTMTENSLLLFNSSAFNINSVLLYKSTFLHFKQDTVLEIKAHTWVFKS